MLEISNSQVSTLYASVQSNFSEKERQEMGKHVDGRKLQYHDAETMVQSEFEGLLQSMRTKAQENRESLLQFSRLNPTKCQQQVNSIIHRFDELIKSMNVPRRETSDIENKISGQLTNEEQKQRENTDQSLKNRQEAFQEQISKNERKIEEKQVNESTINASQNHQSFMRIKEELYNDFQHKIRSFSADVFHANSNGAGDSLSVALHQIDKNRGQYVSNFGQLAKMRLMNDTALTQQLLSEIVAYLYFELNKQYALFRRNWGLSQLSNNILLLILISLSFAIFKNLKESNQSKNSQRESFLRRSSRDTEEIIGEYCQFCRSILGFFIRQSAFSASNYQQWISHYQNCTRHIIATASNPISEKDPKRVEFSPLPSRQRVIMKEFEARSEQYVAQCSEAKREMLNRGQRKDARLPLRQKLGGERRALDFATVKGQNIRETSEDSLLAESIRNIQLAQTQLRSLRNNRIETAEEADLRCLFDISERIFQNVETIISRTRSNLENSELGYANDQTRAKVRTSEHYCITDQIGTYSTTSTASDTDTDLMRQSYRDPVPVDIQLCEKLLKEFSSVLRSVNLREEEQFHQRLNPAVPQQASSQSEQSSNSEQEQSSNRAQPSENPINSILPFVSHLEMNQNHLMMETYQNVGAIYAIWKGKNGQNQRATSTAFLISANQLVTCSHAIYSLESEQFCDEYFFIPGCRESDKIKVEVFPFERQKVKSTIDTVPRDQRHRNEEFEFSVITLPKPVYLRQYLEITAANDVKLSSDSEIALIGYGKPVLIYEEKTGIVNISAPRRYFLGKVGELIEKGSILHHNLPTDYGMGGSPILLNEGPNSGKVVGIHTAGSMNKDGNNSALYFSNKIFKNIEILLKRRPKTVNTPSNQRSRYSFS